MMQNAKELENVVVKLQDIAASINEAAEVLIGYIDSTSEPGALTDSLKPSLENIREIMKNFSKDGYGDAMKEIIKKHGSNNLTNLSPDEYVGVMEDTEVFANAT